MTPQEQLQADLRARVVDQRRVVDEMLRSKKERGLSPGEKRGIAATVRALLKPLLKLVGINLP